MREFASGREDAMRSAIPRASGPSRESRHNINIACGFFALGKAIPGGNFACVGAGRGGAMQRVLFAIAALAVAALIGSSARAEEPAGAGPGPGAAAELARVYAQILRDPTNSVLNLRYAELAETNGKLHWALAAYERVLVNDPGNAEAQAGLQRVRRRLQPDSPQFTAELGAIGESNPRYLPSGARAEIQGLASLGMRDERALGDVRWRTTASAFGLLHSNEHDLN